jgi:hypothetical protein
LTRDPEIELADVMVDIEDSVVHSSIPVALWRTESAADEQTAPRQANLPSENRRCRDGAQFQREARLRRARPAPRGSFMDFLMPTAAEIPDIAIVHLEAPSLLNPLGVKGVGEAEAIPVPALVAEAVDDALAPFGVRVREMPLSPTRIRELIEQATAGAGGRT